MAKYLDESGVRKLWTKTKEKAGEAERNAVATVGSYTVNGYKISSNPTLNKGDVGLGNVDNVAQIPSSQKGVPNGVATLGADGKVPSSQLPSYVDDVLEYAGKSTFPATGETGKIYVDTSTNKTYRWGGTTYVEISASLALGETPGTAYEGSKGAALAKNVSALGNTVGDIPDIMLTGIDTIAESAADGTAITIHYDAYDRASKSELSASTEIPAATSSKAGVMSKADKAKLDGIAAGANAYSHPAGNAASKAEGLYKISTDAQSHVASVAVVKKEDITALGIPAQDTTYLPATSSAAGLMSKEDKKLLDYYNANRGSYLKVSYSGDLVYGTDNVKLGQTFQGSMDAGDNIDVILLAATTEQAGAMSATDKAKLESIKALTDAEIDAILV